MCQPMFIQVSEISGSRYKTFLQMKMLFVQEDFIADLIVKLKQWLRRFVQSKWEGLFVVIMVLWTSDRNVVKDLSKAAKNGSQWLWVKRKDATWTLKWWTASRDAGIHCWTFLSGRNDEERGTELISQKMSLLSWSSWRVYIMKE